jgi:hypothetical protein
MTVQLQTQVKAASTPTLSFTPVPSGLLQRKCACGGSPGLDDECEECQSKRLTLQRYSVNRANPSEPLRSLGEHSNPDSNVTVESGFSNNFGQVQVHTRVPERIQTKLNVNEPGDQHEQEADRAAEQVMMGVPLSGDPPVLPLSPSPSINQRALGDETAQRQSLPQPKRRLRPKHLPKLLLLF